MSWLLTWLLPKSPWCCRTETLSSRSDFLFFIVFLLNSTTAESLTNQNEAELQRRFQERQQEIDQMQQVLETKIQLLQEVRPLKTYMSPKVTQGCAAKLRMTSFK